MKIALNTTEAVDVRPSEDGQGIDLAAYKFGVKVGQRTATPDQIGALIFALEQALEERKTKEEAKRSGCCADPRPDCMGAVVPGIGDKCGALRAKAGG